MNQMMAMATRVKNEEDLRLEMKGEIFRFLDNDEICHRCDVNTQIDHERKLAEIQIESTDPIFDFLKARFEISLNVWTAIRSNDDHQDESVKNILPVLDKLDPWVINSIMKITRQSKSAALGLTLIMQDGIEEVTNFDRISLSEAVDIARLDEQF